MDTLIRTDTQARIMAASIGAAAMGRISKVADTNSAVVKTDFVVVRVDSAAASTEGAAGKSRYDGLLACGVGSGRPSAEAQSFAGRRGELTIE